MRLYRWVRTSEVHVSTIQVWQELKYTWEHERLLTRDKRLH